MKLTKNQQKMFIESKGLILGSIKATIDCAFDTVSNIQDIEDLRQYDIDYQIVVNKLDNDKDLKSIRTKAERILDKLRYLKN